MEDPISGCCCGSLQPYATCCAPLHQGGAAATAEALMRSRYSAFVLGLAEYLLVTWHPSTQPRQLVLDADVKWLGLTVKTQQTTGRDTATVEFVARSRAGGAPAQRLHEVSRFVREGGRWFYLDGDVL